MKSAFSVFTSREMSLIKLISGFPNGISDKTNLLKLPENVLDLHDDCPLVDITTKVEWFVSTGLPQMASECLNNCIF